MNTPSDPTTQNTVHDSIFYKLDRQIEWFYIILNPESN